MKHQRTLYIPLLCMFAHPCAMLATCKKKQQHPRISCDLQKKETPSTPTPCAQKSDSQKKSASLQPPQSVLNEKVKEITATVVSVPEQKKAETITIVNAITDKMITYEAHWAKPKPSHFQVTINQKPVGNNESVTVPVSDGKVTVAYACEFKRFGIMYHQEKKELSFPLPAGHKQANITFCWDQKDRITLQAQPNLIEAQSENV